MSNDPLEKIKSFAKKHLPATPCHDFLHAERVRKLALKIAKEENLPCNSFILEASAYLHDIADRKFFPNHKERLNMIQSFLKSIKIPEEKINAIMHVIKSISFKGADENPKTPEAIILHDADKLDAIGAIGIARTFAYCGYNKGKFYDKTNPKNPEKMTYEEYRHSTPINHFHEKLLKIKDILKTKTAKRLAEERHEFLIKFLEQFMKELKQD